MNELISISNSTINGQSVNTVNARNLHAFLEVGKDFSTWIKVQIERARLVENRDYLVFTQKGENPNGGRPSLDYFLTIDAAKHVAMMSGTEKGFEVRDYFIECEHRAKSISQPFRLPATFAEALRALADESEKTAALQKQIDITQPKAEALDRIALADGNHCITNSAKILQARPKDVFSLLQAKQWIYRRMGGKGWVAYQDKIQQGLLTHKVTTVTDIHTGYDKVIEHVLVTPKGLAKLSTMLGQQAA
jgi:anti-repressor protein